MYDENTDFVIIQTCDLEHWVVEMRDPVSEEMNTLTTPFDTKEQAIEWAKHIKDNYHIYVEEDI